MYSPAPFTKLLVSSLLVLFVTACGKDDAPDNNLPDYTIPGSEYVLQEVLGGEGHALANYEYNANWQVTKYVNRYKYGRTWAYTTYSYTYDNNGRLTQLTIVPITNTSFSSSIEYSYNSQGRIVSMKSYNNAGQLASVSEVAYHGKTIIETNFVAGVVYSTTTYTLDDRNNLINKVVDRASASEIDTYEEWSDFDDRPSYLLPDNVLVTSKNNPCKYSYSQPSGIQRSTFTYLYNNAGYLKESKQVIDDNQVLIKKYAVMPKQ